MTKEASPEFIFITETWLNNQIDDSEICLDGYNINRFDRTSASGQQHGGGIVMYYKSNLDCTTISELNVCSPHIEITWLKLKLINTRAIYFACVYRPPTGNVQEFINSIDNHLNVLNNWGLCEVNICGDTNLDLYQRNPRITTYKNWLKWVGLTNMISEATQIQKIGLGYSLTDHFLTTNSNLFNMAGSIPTNASDYFFIFGVRKKPKSDHLKKKTIGRAYGHLVESEFKKDVNDQNWEEILLSNDTNEAWEIFKDKYLNILHKHAPLKQFNTDRKAHV